ncbi:MAG: SUF system NifU family Fe-S cluster assembly protein [Acidimicrobiaceae bacterium]|nr:SUF system NifU family Fe-S cluster assembly protein [Acidimicrobiaceae bacterium]
MPGLEDLYREIILDHYKNPRNEGEFPTPPAIKAEGHNPLCGDELTVYVILEGSVIKDIRIAGQGCSISRSSASLMSVAVKGKTLQEVDRLLSIFKSMMSISTNTSGETEAVDPVEYSERELGELIALQGVVKFPVRIKCATLSWNTLVQALEDRAS